MKKPMLDLIERMLPIVPKGLDTFFFWNSGAEAIEGKEELETEESIEWLTL